MSSLTERQRMFINVSYCIVYYDIIYGFDGVQILSTETEITD